MLSLQRTPGEAQRPERKPDATGRGFPATQGADIPEGQKEGQASKAAREGRTYGEHTHTQLHTHSKPQSHVLSVCLVCRTWRGQLISPRVSQGLDSDLPQASLPRKYSTHTTLGHTFIHIDHTRTHSTFHTHTERPQHTYTMHVRTYHPHINTYTHIHIHTQIHTKITLYTICTHTHICVHIYTHRDHISHTLTCTYTRHHIHIYVLTYIYIHTYTHIEI